MRMRSCVWVPGPLKDIQRLWGCEDSKCCQGSQRTSESSCTGCSPAKAAGERVKSGDGIWIKAYQGIVFFPGCWHVAPSKNEDSTVMLNCEWGSDRFRFRCYEMWKAWKIECTCNTDTFHSDCFLVSVHPMVYNLGAEAACCHRLSLYNVKAEKGLQPAFSSF